MDLPAVVSREEWRNARIALLEEEKAATATLDRIAERRRALPMVEIVKPYTFAGPGGEATLLDLFEGRRQLVVYHFMWVGDQGCSSCSVIADSMGDIRHLHATNTSLVMVSRAPWPDIERFQKRMGWTTPWYSSHGTDFNLDFHVSQDPDVTPVEYNFQDRDTLVAHDMEVFTRGDGPGISVFLSDGDRVFHTYSTYARGVEPLLAPYHVLDLTPLGRQRHVMEFPYHDKYGEGEHHCH